MATTTNFGWETPDDTDLVKDGALAMRTLGNSIDSSFVDLKGGTTGQVLAKASNTDLDYTWVTQDDANAIQNAIVDAKGDLIAATAADTPARLAVGNNGDTLVADSSTSTGLRWQGAYTAGKNAILNGALDIWQRGTSFSGTPVYTADRWLASFGNSVTVSRSTDVPNSNFLYSLQLSGSNFATISQRIEGAIARQFVGRDVVISFWAKSNASTTLSVALQAPSALDNWASASFLGGSGSVSTTTTWQRFSFVIAASNLTSTAANGLGLGFNGPSTSQTYNITGIQMEIGNVATPFQTATGTLAGELAACQRYYYRQSWTTGGNVGISSGISSSTTTSLVVMAHPVFMRVAPSAVDWSVVAITNCTTYTTDATAVTIESASPGASRLQVNVTGQTTNQPVHLILKTNSFIGLSAEL